VSPGPTRPINLDFRHYPLRRLPTATATPCAGLHRLVTSGRIGVPPEPERHRHGEQLTDLERPVQ